MPLHLTKVLPPFSSLANAVAGGLVSGDYFLLTGIVLGLNTVNLVVRVP